MTKTFGGDKEKRGNVSRSLSKYGDTFFFLCLLAASALIIILRRPDVATNPQFWAEDGHYWYSQAYNNGLLSSLITPENGYLQTVSRLAAAMAQLLPLRYAPYFFNYLAVIIQLLPIAVLWSARFRPIVPSRIVRFVLTACYIFVPNSFEGHGNITNAHWRLALAAFMLIVAGTKSTPWRRTALEGVFFLMVGLSGPFALFLLPPAILHWLKKRLPSTKIQVFVLALAALCQSVFVVLGLRAARSDAPLGASWQNLERIIGGQVFGSGIFGHQFAGWAGEYPLYASLAFWAGSALVLYALFKGGWEVKLFIIFSALIFAASLAAPQASLSESQWAVLTQENNTVRYYFFPILAWFAVLVWYASRKELYLRVTGCMLLLAAAVGFASDFRYNSFVDYRFGELAEQFETLPSGQTFTFPLNPPGWSMTLIKR